MEKEKVIQIIKGEFHTIGLTNKGRMFRLESVHDERPEALRSKSLYQNLSQRWVEIKVKNPDFKEL